MGSFIHHLQFYFLHNRFYIILLKVSFFKEILSFGYLYIHHVQHSCINMYNHLTYLAKIIRTYFVSDKTYLSKRFAQKLGYRPNLSHPQSFNEKVTSRMIYERDPLHTTLADKLAIRDVIEGKICPSHMVPLLGVYHCFNEINFDQLPEKFVLKCNHDNGSAMICKDKSQFDLKKAERKLTRHLKQNMYYLKREWHYKNIQPVILVEQYVELLSDQETQLTITTYSLSEAQFHLTSCLL